MNVTYNQNYLFPAFFTGPVQTELHQQSMNFGMYGTAFHQMATPSYYLMPGHWSGEHYKNTHSVSGKQFQNSKYVAETESMNVHSLDGVKHFDEFSNEESAGIVFKESSDICTDMRYQTYNKTVCDDNVSKPSQSTQVQPSPIHQLRLPTITVTSNMAANVMSEECDLGYCSFTDLSPLPEITSEEDNAHLCDLLEAQSAFSDIIDDVLESINDSDLDDHSILSSEVNPQETINQSYEKPTTTDNFEPIRESENYGFLKHVSQNQHMFPQINWTIKSENLSFEDANTRSEEMTSHTNEFGCILCGKLFPTKATQKAHMRMHKGERPHQCNYCEKSFSQKSTLRTHIRTHTGEKPYACTHCARAFSDYSTFRKHVRIHTGEKPYTCDVCQRRFTQSGNMIRHREMHSRTRK